jgi:hypothetical protein
LVSLLVGLLLLVNAIFFGCTLCHLWRSLREVAEANILRDKKQKFILHAKLTSVMGFTRVTGLLANIPYLEFMRYPFLFLACSNSFFISASFMFRQGQERHQGKLDLVEFIHGVEQQWSRPT